MCAIKYSILLWIIIFSYSPLSEAQTVADRTDTIAKQLMCPVCAGQSVAESNSELARDMRKLIKKKIAKGKTDEEIILWFRGKYGDTILAKPPLKGFNLVVWLLPFAAVATGVAFAVFYIRKNTRG